MYHSVTPHPVAPPAASQRSGVARFWYQMGPGSRQRRQDAYEDARRTAALRADWQIACQHAGLGMTVYPGSGPTLSVPRVVRADWRSLVVSFTVELRPGQPAAELMAAEPWLARALGVDGLFMTEMRDGWVKVEVVNDGHRPPGAGAGVRSGRPRVPDHEVA